MLVIEEPSAEVLAIRKEVKPKDILEKLRPRATRLKAELEREKNPRTLEQIANEYRNEVLTPKGKDIMEIDQQAKMDDLRKEINRQNGFDNNEQDNSNKGEQQFNALPLNNNKPLKEKKLRKRRVFGALKDSSLNANELLNRPVYSVSAAQLLEISPKLRVYLKRQLVMKKQEEGLLVKRSASGAPRTWGYVEGLQVPMILDGGSTTNIISTRLARLLSLPIKTSSSTLTMANGIRIPVVGKLEGVRVRLHNFCKKINTVVLDTEEYAFLGGRNLLSTFAIGTNWDTYKWTLGNRPLKINYDVPVDWKSIEEQAGDKSNNEYDESEEWDSETDNYGETYLCIDDAIADQKKLNTSLNDKQFYELEKSLKERENVIAL